jgi:acetylornithine/succinyldiaminopimelate/putrescine aminotransferase
VSIEPLPPPAPASASLFRPADERILRLIRERNGRKLPTFVNPYLPLLREGAQAAFLLNAYLNDGAIGRGSVRYKTFFANSWLEALHGAIKVARHRAQQVNASAGGAVLIHDPDELSRALFDPVSRGVEAAAVPQLHFRSTLDEVAGDLARRSWAALVCVVGDSFEAETCRRLLRGCAPAIFVLDGSRAPWRSFDAAYRELGERPDVVVWGEAMTAHQVPFAAFSTADTVYRPWTSLAGSMLHSSTYGGNGLSLMTLLEVALDELGWGARYPGLREHVDDLGRDLGRMRTAYARYVNPTVLEVFRAPALDHVVEWAHGTRILVRRDDGGTSELIDGLGAGGCSLRGHNPEDIVPEVVEQHDPDRDYWSELALRLATMSGLPCAFPAVSGSSAVDIALTLALLANPARDRIVTFDRNFAGRTLLSLAATSGASNAPFAPLYPAVTKVDFRAPDSAAALEAELRSGRVAVVWFETLQGQTSRRVPAELLALVERHREEMGYLVGVDEVLTGMFRCGPFLFHQGQLGTPDLVTLSKGLSDMTFPVAATLVSERVHRGAISTNPALVAHLEAMYRNQLGAHVALHAVDKAVELNLGERAARAGEILRAGLGRVAQSSPLVKEVRGDGLCLHIVGEADAFPLNYLGEVWVDMMLSRAAQLDGGVALYFNRLNPALTIGDDELARMLAGLEESLRGNKWRTLLRGYRHAVGLLFGALGAARRANRDEVPLLAAPAEGVPR